MLCQLVCLDRRYQRMNCFNIREVEALLKGRFFPDLVNTHDHRLLVTNSTLGLRFKTNNLDTINHATLLFHQYGLQATNQSRYTHFFLNSKTLGNSYEFSPNGFDVLKTTPAGFGSHVPVRVSESDGAIPSIGFELEF